MVSRGIRRREAGAVARRRAGRDAARAHGRGIANPLDISSGSQGSQDRSIDFGGGIIEAAKSFAKGANLDIDFSVGDAEQTGLPSGAFDVITSTCGIMLRAAPRLIQGLGRPIAPAITLARPACLTAFGA